MEPVVAVVGATGAVGREMLATLARRRFPAGRIVALASARSAGTTLDVAGRSFAVEEARPEAFSGVDIALFSAGAAASRELAPVAAAAGAVVIDNSSAWRMHPEVPLVVPEVNPAAAADRPKGIIANPNCSTIQMLVALAPLHRAARLRHVVVSTYQAASGKGQAAIEELRRSLKAAALGEPFAPEVFPGDLALNVLSDWKAGEGGYSEEELKMINETRKILGDPEVGVSPTTVRVPVFNAHAESVHAQFHRPLTAAEARDLLRGAAGVALDERPYAPGAHPQPRDASGRDEVFVGRVRDDLAVPGAVNLWIVADNLRKGAALNAVQIAELLLAEPARGRALTPAPCVRAGAPRPVGPSRRPRPVGPHRRRGLPVSAALAAIPARGASRPPFSPACRGPYVASTLPPSDGAPPPEVRARYMKTMLSALERFGGPAAAVRARVGAPLLERIEGATPTAWLPIECNVALVEAIALELGPERAHEYFRAAANHVYETSLFKGFVHMASNLFGLTPAAYVKLAPKGWSLAYRDCGEFAAISCGEGEATLEVCQVPRPCATAVWLESARSSFYSCFDLCGLPDGRVEWGELDLRARRAVFLFRWGAAPAARRR